MRFGYHTHGYEMVPSPDGTLFDTLAKALDPKLVHFQVDVFHTYHGGADPIGLMEKYKGRVRSLHLKDIKKGYPRETGQGNGDAGRGRAAGHGPDRLAGRPARGHEGGGDRVLQSRREHGSAHAHPAEHRLLQGLKL
jgi:hypothetical protein